MSKESAGTASCVFCASVRFAPRTDVEEFYRTLASERSRLNNLLLRDRSLDFQTPERRNTG